MVRITSYCSLFISPAIYPKWVYERNEDQTVTPANSHVRTKYIYEAARELCYYLLFP